MSGLLLAARGRRETRPGGADGDTQVVREGGEKRRGEEREGEACAWNTQTRPWIGVSRVGHVKICVRHAK